MDSEWRCLLRRTFVIIKYGDRVGNKCSTKRLTSSCQGVWLMLMPQFCSWKICRFSELQASRLFLFSVSVKCGCDSQIVEGFARHSGVSGWICWWGNESQLTASVSQPSKQVSAGDIASVVMESSFSVVPFCEDITIIGLWVKYLGTLNGRKY